MYSPKSSNNIMLSSATRSVPQGNMLAQSGTMSHESLGHTKALLTQIKVAKSASKDLAAASAVTEPPTLRNSPALAVPASVKPMIVGLKPNERITEDQLPAIVARHPVWLQLSKLDKAVYLVQSSQHQAILMLQLRESGLQLVLKAVSRDRVAGIANQIQAEITAAEYLPWHPLIGTLRAASFDDDGTWCCVMPYVGCSLQSVIESPEWWSSTTAEDRLAVTRLVIAHSLVVYEIMQEADTGFIYRDVKPSNVCMDPSTGRVNIIDFGLMIKATLEDYFDGFTPGYFAPEFVDLSVFRNKEKRQQAINPTTDVFLTSFMGLEVAVGLDDLPWELRSSKYDLDTGKGIIGLLQAHAAAGRAGYADLISRVACPVAQDFFRQTMCCDPDQRLTPALALQHQWLAGCKKIIQKSLAVLDPIYQQQNHTTMQLLKEVPGVYIPSEQCEQQPEVVDEATDVRRASSSSWADSKLAPSTPQLSDCGVRLEPSSVHSSGSNSESIATANSVKKVPAAAASAAVVPAALARTGVAAWGKKVVKKVIRYSKAVVKAGARLARSCSTSSLRVVLLVCHHQQQTPRP